MVCQMDKFTCIREDQFLAKIGECSRCYENFALFNQVDTKACLCYITTQCYVVLQQYATSVDFQMLLLMCELYRIRQ